MEILLQSYLKRNQIKNIILFIIFCLAWGTTWIAIKYGVVNSPPIFFAGTRFFIAGLILVLFVYFKNKSLNLGLLKNKYLYITSLMIISLTFGLIFWGEQFVSPSITAILVQGLIPLLLPFFAIVYGIDKFNYKYLISVSIGLLGLYFIFNIGYFDYSNVYLYGLIALVVGTIFYCWGSIIVKINIKNSNIIELSGYQNIIGGVILIIVAFMYEFDRIINEEYYLNFIVIFSWIHLVFIGSIVGFTLYLYFIQKWGAQKVSLYTFITPIIAILIDSYMLNTELNINEYVGIVLILFSIIANLIFI